MILFPLIAISHQISVLKLSSTNIKSFSNIYHQTLKNGHKNNSKYCFILWRTDRKHEIRKNVELLNVITNYMTENMPILRKTLTSSSNNSFDVRINTSLLLMCIYQRDKAAVFFVFKKFSDQSNLAFLKFSSEPQSILTKPGSMHPWVKVMYLYINEGLQA